EISIKKGKALLKELKEMKKAAEHDFEGIVKGSARQPRKAKTPPSETGDDGEEGHGLEERDDHEKGEDDEEGNDDEEGDDFEEGHDDDEEADNAETELATSDVEEEHLGAPLTGGPLKPRQSSASLDMQVSGMYADPEKTAFDVFCQYLEVSRSHMVNAEEGLAVAFQSVVMDPVEKLGKFGSELKTLATDYGPAMFVLSQLFYCVYIEGLTDNVKLINKRTQKFSDDYVQLFNTKRPSDTMIGNFNTALARFPTFLELECLKNAFDESKLAHDVPASMKLQYILQHASRDVHSLLGRIYHARCDGQYGRSNRDTKLRLTNLESMLTWLASYCQEKRGADFSRKGKKAALSKMSTSEPGPSSQGKGKSVLRQEEGTYEQIVRFLLRSHKALLSKHENAAQKARDAAADKQGDKKKATGKRTHEDDDDDLEDDNGEGTSEKKPRKKSSSSKSTKSKDVPAAQTVKYRGITWAMPKDFFDLMVKRSMLKEEADEVIIVDDD
ncbi:hypothetical protein HDU78_000446, partial [Chytriomyces hyalinus]